MRESSHCRSHRDPSLLFSSLCQSMDPSQTPSSSYGSPRQDVRLMTLYEEGESDLLPMARDRCNTWPLRRPQMDLTNTTSPLIHEGIPEERESVHIIFITLYHYGTNTYRVTCSFVSSGYCSIESRRKGKRRTYSLLCRGREKIVWY